MSLSKAFGALVATALVGSLTFFFTAPKKVIKQKARTAKTSTQNGIEEKENLFI